MHVLYATMGQLPSFLLNTRSAARQSFNGVLENYPSEQQRFRLVKVTVTVGRVAVVPSCCITTLNFFANFSRIPNYQLIGWKIGNSMEYPSLKNSPCGAAHQQPTIRKPTRPMVAMLGGSMMQPALVACLKTGGWTWTASMCDLYGGWKAG